MESRYECILPLYLSIRLLFIDMHFLSSPSFNLSHLSCISYLIHYAYPPFLFLSSVYYQRLSADKFYRPPPQTVSLFKAVLQRISAMLDSVRPEWSGTAPENGVISVDSSSEFYRLWSGLQFVCCLPTGENELSNHELFGDGLFWAGATIIHFLGQQLRFEVFDFSYHISNVEESAAVPCTNPVCRTIHLSIYLFSSPRSKSYLLSSYLIINTNQPTGYLPILQESMANPLFESIGIQHPLRLLPSPSERYSHLTSPRKR